MRQYYLYPQSLRTFVDNFDSYNWIIMKRGLETVRVIIAVRQAHLTNLS